MNLNVDLMENNVIQINVGITIKVDVSVKNVKYVNNIMFGIFEIHNEIKQPVQSDIILWCSEIVVMLKKVYDS